MLEISIRIVKSKVYLVKVAYRIIYYKSQLDYVRNISCILKTL